MANLNLNLVLSNFNLVNATKLGCDAVATNSGRGMRPTLSQKWQLVLPRFTAPKPPYAPTAYEEPGEVNRPGSHVIPTGRIAAAFWVTSSASTITGLRRVSDKGLSERGVMQHRLQHDHDYPSQDRHDVQQRSVIGSNQPSIGSAFNTGNRK
jgi:hypothetical protein